MEKQLNWIIEQIVKEIEPLLAKKYTGNITFRLNLCDGGISNINVGSDKSIKNFENQIKK